MFDIEFQRDQNWKPRRVPKSIEYKATARMLDSYCLSFESVCLTVGYTWIMLHVMFERTKTIISFWICFLALKVEVQRLSRHVHPCDRALYDCAVLQLHYDAFVTELHEETHEPDVIDNLTDDGTDGQRTDGQRTDDDDGTGGDGRTEDGQRTDDDGMDDGMDTPLSSPYEKVCQSCALAMVRPSAKLRWFHRRALGEPPY